MAYSIIKPSGGSTGAPLNLRKRLALIQRYVDVQGKKILDGGCGSGQYVKALLQSGADAYGIEYDEEKMAQFGLENPVWASRVQAGNLETMEFETGSFDVVLMNEVLEHVPNEFLALREIHRVLKSNGYLIIFSPNRLYPFETHGVCIKKSGCQLPIYVLGIPYIPLPLGERIFDYVARNYWPRQLRQQVMSCGFNIVGTEYVWQTFENISGSQPRFLDKVTPLLRYIFSFFENLPGIKVFGVSQLVIAKKYH
jgi:2-polyprenyl-3-methyl-5-hydroxy-6-metoxy-1,4-benzoquinol methylase